MPHQCTNCDRLFPNGSKEMLSGCPGCGGNKFQFLPSSAVDDGALAGSGDDTAAAESEGDMQFGHASAGSDSARPADRERSNTPDSSSAPSGDVPSTPLGDQGGSEDATSEQDQDIIDADARSPPPREDSAQANARSTVISDDEIREAGARPPEPEDAAEEPEETPDLSALREELNEQFESIKILEPGQYELNLMELYDRQEYIIALEEDGRYAIEVPDSWREDEEQN